MLRRVRDGVTVELRIQPGASANRIIGPAAGDDGKTVLKAAVTAAPEKGKANDALIRLLAGSWRLAKSEVTVIRGATDRRKVVHIAGEPGELEPYLKRKIEALNG